MVCNDGTLFNIPSRQDAIDIGLKSGRESFLDLELITQPVTFCHRSFIEIRKQRCKPLDAVVWLLQKLCDRNWVVETVRKS